METPTHVERFADKTALPVIRSHFYKINANKLASPSIGTYLVYVSLVILTEGFHGFPQLLQTNVKKKP
jgi:hypothetical protein